jgi:hypothetical protein
MLSGFNRGNVDWFHACALKRGIRSVESSFGDTWNKWPNPATPEECAMSPLEPSREALWKFPQAARERSPAAIIPSKWEARLAKLRAGFHVRVKTRPDRLQATNRSRP